MDKVCIAMYILSIPIPIQFLLVNKFYQFHKSQHSPPCIYRHHFLPAKIINFAVSPINRAVRAVRAQVSKTFFLDGKMIPWNHFSLIQKSLTKSLP